MDEVLVVVVVGTTAFQRLEGLAAADCGGAFSVAAAAGTAGEVEGRAEDAFHEGLDGWEGGCYYADVEFGAEGSQFLLSCYMLTYVK